MTMPDPTYDARFSYLYVVSYIARLLAYVLTIVLLFLAASMAATGNGGRAMALLLAAFFTTPVSDRAVRRYLRHGLFVWRWVAVTLLCGWVVWYGIGQEHDSIYSSPQVREQFHELYGEKMREWPVPYDSEFVDTEYGPVHVLLSGPPDGKPMLLLHASGVGSWSWKWNVAELSGPYRTYAIDLIGDVGLSEYRTLEHTLRNGADQAGLYASIMDHFAIDSAVVVGASEGGFIATNLALHHPDRVDRLILLGPMGYSGATSAIIRITLTQMFPFRQFQESTFRWAFSANSVLQKEYETWFSLLMKEVFPRKVAPVAFSHAERQSLSVPVLFVFGRRDNLVGDPDRAIALVQDVPDVSVLTIDAGHLMAAEDPEIVDQVILGYSADARDGN